MATSAYRDETTGFTARLEGLRDDVDRCETRLPPSVWRYLSRSVAAELLALRDAVPREAPTTHEAATALATRLETYRARLELAIEAARDLEPRIGVAPDSAPGLEPRHAFGPLARFAFDLGEASVRLGLGGWPARIEEASRSFHRIVAARFPVTRFDAPSPFARRIEVRAFDAPVCLLLELPPFRGGYLDAIEMRAATHVALGMPSLALVPETMMGADVLVGDPAFDGLFQISAATADDARTVLVTEVRDALVRLAWHDVPTVVVGEGRAEIAWTYEPTRDAIDDACRALAALRKLRLETRLLSW